MELGADVSGPSPDYQMRPISGTFPRHGTGEWLAAGLAAAVELQTKVPEDYAKFYIYRFYREGSNANQPAPLL